MEGGGFVLDKTLSRWLAVRVCVPKENGVCAPNTFMFIKQQSIRHNTH
jgi:hypothetical protein